MKLLELPKGTFSEKILFIGEPGSGKTSLINSYRNNSITSRYSPTIGVEISNALLKLNDQCIIDLNLWDMGRILKSAVNSLTRCYSGADLVLICVDMTRKQDFDLIDNKFEEIRFKISP